MARPEVGVAEINNAEMTIAGTKIPKISTYHSIEFHSDHMRMWRYFDIGQGVKQTYNNLLIEPAIQLLLPYSKTDCRIARIQSGKQKVAKKRDDRQLCTLLFCPELGCTESFEEPASLETHMLSGLHTIAKEMSSIDKVRKSFVEKMKVTSRVHLPVSTTRIECLDMNEAVEVSTYMMFFQGQGWALPVHSNFRYSNRQKRFLYKHFISGEESGKKMSPEQVNYF